MIIHPEARTTPQIRAEIKASVGCNILLHLTPIQKLKEWRLKSPDLFKKRVYDLSGLDS